MNRNLLVRTAKFPTEPEGDLEFCNGRPGSAFAGYLQEMLESKGFNCDKPLQEDYGWGFWISQEKLTVWVTVCFAPEQDDKPGSGIWYLSADFELPFGFLNPNYWFGQRAGKELEANVFNEIKEYIISDKDIELIQEE